MKLFSIRKNMLTLAIWGAVIITGFLALGAIVGGIEGLAAFSRIHSFFVRLGLVYTSVMILKHLWSKKSGFVSQAIKDNRGVKIATAVIFHIVLHIISIHLAVAYTVFHIIQHKRRAAI